MLVWLCLLQDSSTLKKRPLSAMLSPLFVLSRSPLDHIVGVGELFLGAVGLRSCACETLEKADFVKEMR